MIFLKMNKIRSLIALAILICLPSFVMSQDKKGISSCISEADAINQIKSYYNSLNDYLDGIRKKQGQGTARDNIKYLFGYQDPQTITEDYRFVLEKGISELSSKIKLSSYLENFANPIFEVYKSVKNGLSYELKDTYDYKTIDDSTIQLNADIIIDRTPCTAKFRFIGKRIRSITVNKKMPTSPIPFGCNLSAGWKITNGLNLGFDLDGLSKKWFGNRMSYGLEFIRLWGDYDAHYPSSDGNPATMTYKTQNKDWAIGPKIGYAFIGKYSNYDIDDNFRFSMYLGVGVVRYNFWFERTGNTSSEPHSSTAPYFKPSGRFEWGRLGFEVGWYLSAKGSPINGPTIQFIINIP